MKPWNVVEAQRASVSALSGFIGSERQILISSFIYCRLTWRPVCSKLHHIGRFEKTTEIKNLWNKQQNTSNSFTLSCDWNWSTDTVLRSRTCHSIYHSASQLFHLLAHTRFLAALCGDATGVMQRGSVVTNAAGHTQTFWSRCANAVMWPQLMCDVPFVWHARDPTGVWSLRGVIGSRGKTRWSWRGPSSIRLRPQENSNKCNSTTHGLINN